MAKYFVDLTSLQYKFSINVYLQCSEMYPWQIEFWWTKNWCNLSFILWNTFRTNLWNVTIDKIKLFPIFSWFWGFVCELCMFYSIYCCIGQYVGNYVDIINSHIEIDILPLPPSPPKKYTGSSTKIGIHLGDQSEVGSFSQHLNGTKLIGLGTHIYGGFFWFFLNIMFSFIFQIIFHHGDMGCQ